MYVYIHTAFLGGFAAVLKQFVEFQVLSIAVTEKEVKNSSNFPHIIFRLFSH